MMKNPPHPGVSLRHELDAMGVSVDDASDGIGVSRQQLYRVIRGASGISPEMAYRLERAVGGTAGFWLRLQDNWALAQVSAHADEIKVRRLVPVAA